MLICRICKSVEMTLNEKEELTFPLFPTLVSSPLLWVLLENALFVLLLQVL